MNANKCPFPHRAIVPLAAAAGVLALLWYRRATDTRSLARRGSPRRAQQQRAFWKDAQARMVATSALLSPSGSKLRWWCLNDGIMGGKSRSEVTATDGGGLAFSGVVSTDGGGFVSCRGGKLAPGELLPYDAIAVTTSGGAAQTVRLRLDTVAARESRGTGVPSASWSASFVCPVERTTTVLLLADFVPTWRGRPLSRDLAGSLSESAVLSGVETVGLMLSYVRGPNRARFGDGEHAFRLQLDELKWVSRNSK